MPRRPDIPPLRHSELRQDPIEQFRDWYGRAEREVPLAHAVTLATVDSDGRPDARMVLLKGVGADGFRFFSNYDSAKGRQVEGAGYAALVVYWRELDRQVRIRGTVTRLGESDSDAYFATRPRDSQLGAWASPQSEPLGSREELDDRVRELEARFRGREVPRPEFWGGYVLRPETIEFWQGQVGRLHDRFRYVREGEGWRIERLAP
jgi:pyridoxamine 5'-phosphate oxidase